MVAILIGLAFGYGLAGSTRTLGTAPTQQSFTYTHGTVNIGNRGVPYMIEFGNQYTGALSSGVLGDGMVYQLYLPSDRAYLVTVSYLTSSSSGIQICQPRPQLFTPSGSNYTQDFLC